MPENRRVVGQVQRMSSSGQVFISHSSRRDPYAAHVREALSARLREKNYEVLVDLEDIRPGEQWRSTVCHWLARCQVAVVLLNADALKSSWVRREVEILMWRQQLGAPLVVVPVLLGNLRAEDVKKAGYVELGPVQFERNAPDALLDVEPLVERISAALADLPAPQLVDDPMSEWFRRLATYMAPVCDPELLRRAASALGVEDEELGNATALHGGHLYLAHQLVRSDPDRLFSALYLLGPSLSATLKPLIREVRSVWVDSGAARRLLPRAGEDPDKMLLLLNVREQQSARHYVVRATCNRQKGIHQGTVGLPVTSDQRDAELIAEWTEAVWELANMPQGFRKTQLPATLKWRRHYLIIDATDIPMETVAKAVTELHRLFTWLIIIVMTGPSIPGAEDLALLNGHVTVEPLLGEDDEFQGLLLNRDLDQLSASLSDTV